MFDAQLLASKTDGTPVSVFGPWMNRQGDYVRATLEVVKTNLSSGLGTIEARVFHKNSDETGDGAQVGSAISTYSAGRSMVECSGIKELVRYKFTVDASGLSATGWGLFRMLSPVWFDAVKA